PQWVSPTELLYTADGKIKRRPAAGGAARVVELTANVSFTRPAFTPKRKNFDLAGAQPARGILHPAVAPDGTQVAFVALGDLWLMPIGGAPRRLTSDPAVETHPAWSPDGSQIAFSDADAQIQIADVKSGAIRKVHDRLFEAGRPSWSPDG